MCPFPNFSAQGIIPIIVAIQACSLYWGHLEKWLIQFWNPLLMGTNHRICDFPNFSAWCNNSKDFSISYVFSALGAPRKVVDTNFESSYSLGTIVRYAISQIFQHGWIIPMEWHFIAWEIPGDPSSNYIYFRQIYCPSSVVLVWMLF